MKPVQHFVSASCEGETCSMCHALATHKVGEEILHDEPQARHNLTAYVCCACFTKIFGPATGCMSTMTSPTTVTDDRCYCMSLAMRSGLGQFVPTMCEVCKALERSRQT